MNYDDIIQLIRREIPNVDVIFNEGDGCHFSAVIVSPLFEGKSALERQKQVMSALKDQFQTGQLHAFSFKTYTPAEQETLTKEKIQGE